MPEGPRPDLVPAASRRRRGLPPWVNPQAESQWWFAPTRPPRVVDQAPEGAARTRPRPPAGERPPVVDAVGATAPPDGRQQARPTAGGASLREEALAWARGAGPRRLFRRWAARVAVLVVAACVVAAVAQGVGSLVRGGQLGGAGGTGPAPSPTQTELVGVITITNLDPRAPFEGDVHVVARTGDYACRNAPLPQSTWHVQLDPGATLSVPCVIPASSPPTLAAHTFRRAVPSADGGGLALVDNPAPFTGATFAPTPGR